NLAVKRRLVGGGEEVGMHGVGDVGEIAAGGAVAVNGRPLACKEVAGEGGDDAGVGAVGVLPRAEDVEVAKANGIHLVDGGVGADVMLPRQLDGGIGTHRLGR